MSASLRLIEKGASLSPRPEIEPLRGTEMDFNKLLVEGNSRRPECDVPRRKGCIGITFGYSSAEIGRSLDELIIPPDRREEEQAIQRAARETGVVTYESFRRKKDGSLIYINIS